MVGGSAADVVADGTGNMVAAMPDSVVGKGPEDGCGWRGRDGSELWPGGARDRLCEGLLGRPEGWSADDGRKPSWADLAAGVPRLPVVHLFPFLSGDPGRVPVLVRGCRGQV